MQTSLGKVANIMDQMKITTNKEDKFNGDQMIQDSEKKLAEHKQINADLMKQRRYMRGHNEVLDTLYS
jgi:hypothetical protein